MSEPLKLKEKKCIPCSGNIPPLSNEEKIQFKKLIDPDWTLSHQETRLLRKFSFKNFINPMQLATELGALAEEEWHHPELHIGYGHLDVEIWTHKINNLVESDFILAAKVDEIYLEFKNKSC